MRKAHSASILQAVAAVAATAVLVACHEPMGPAPALDLLLTGMWAYAPATPGGGGVFLNLRAAGGTITGTGQEYHLCCLYDSFAVSGDYSDSARSFEVRIRYSKGPSGTFVGQVFGADSLSGAWTGGDATTWFPSTFYRQPDPPCADSAPLMVPFAPGPPGYVVRLQDSVDAAAEAARLAQRYGFTPTAVYQSPLKGFAAFLSPAAVAVLRCEPAVLSIEWDGVVEAS